MPKALWGSSIGKKIVMAVTGAVMIGYLVLHVLGNLKAFSGSEKFNGYSHWLRTFGEPVLPYEGLLWIIRVGLLVSVILHITAAVQLSRRGMSGSTKRHSRRLGGTYVAFTMRSGGIVLGLFIVWHLLDLTTLTVNANAQAGHPYENLLATFDTWYGNAIYLLAVLALGLHLRHGIWSAAQTMGAGTVKRDRIVRASANLVALGLTAGFASVPIGVMTGVVS